MARRTRMGDGIGENLRGMRDTTDPLNEENMMGANPTGNTQVAKKTPDMQLNPSKFTVNPTRGTGPAHSKTVMQEPVTQAHNAARPNKLSGKSDPASKGSRRGMRGKLRRAFGVEMPMQSGNTKGTSEGSKAASQTSFVTQKGHSLNKYHATPSATTIPAARR